MSRVRFWIASIALVSTAAEARAEDYATERDAEAAKIREAYAKGPNNEAVTAEHAKALDRLRPLLERAIPTITLGPRYKTTKTVRPNLFIPGDIDSFCEEGISFDVEDTEKGLRFSVLLTKESLLAHADAELAKSDRRWKKGSTTGVANLADASHVLYEVFCNDAAHTQIAKLDRKAAKELRASWLIAESQDEVQNPTALVGLLVEGTTFVFIKYALPEGFAKSLACDTQKGGEKSRIRCLQKGIGEAMIAPHRANLVAFAKALGLGD